MPIRGRLPVRAALALVLTAGAALAASGPVAGQSIPSFLELTPALVGDVTRVDRGGAALGDDALYDVNLQIQLDGDTLGWRGGYVFLYVLGNGGTDPSRHVGDFQGVDNIAAPRTWKVFELWVEQHFRDDRASALLGLYDLNSEFDVIASEDVFLNSSFGIGPDFSQSGVNGPSIFPTTSLALRLMDAPLPRWRVEAAVLDGVPGDPRDPYGTHVELSASDGLLLAGEIAYFVPARGAEDVARQGARDRQFHVGAIGREQQPAYDTKIAIGGWGYTRRLPTVDAGRGPGYGHSYGGYLLGEARVVHQEGDARGVWAFGRVGLASDRVNQVGEYVGGGLSWRGPWSARADDVAGIAFGAARDGAPYLDARSVAGAPTDRWEFVIEATYCFQALGWLAAQPDVQYVVHPDMDPTLRSALLVGLRLTIEPTVR